MRPGRPGQPCPWQGTVQLLLGRSPVTVRPTPTVGARLIRPSSRHEPVSDVGRIVEPSVRPVRQLTREIQSDVPMRTG